MCPATDPFEAHLKRAEQLFQTGDVVQAGQIWQAVLKRVPGHAEARAGLYKVKLYFDARATQDGLAEAQALAQKLAPTQASPEEVERRLQRGCELYDAGDIREALDIWEALLAQNPDHALARGYAEGARRALEAPKADPTDTADGVILSTQALPVPEAPMPDAPAPAAPAEALDDEGVERLLREGCTLYDLGQPEEAQAKWERILEERPGHRQARSYLEGLRRDLGLPPLDPVPAAEAPAAPESANSAPAEVDLDTLLRAGAQLFDLGMTEEAIAKWEEAQALAPEDTRIGTYLAQARRELEPRAPSFRPTAPLPPPLPTPVPTPISNPIPVPVPVPAPMPAPPAPTEAPLGLVSTDAVVPPTPLTEPAPPPRKGIDLPKAVGSFALPAWARSPRNLALLVGGGLLLSLALGLIRGKQREIRNRRDRADARAAAIAPVARSVQVPDLGFGPEQMKRELEDCLGEDPFRAYCLAQELIRRDPSAPEPPRLMEKVRTAMATLGGAPVDPRELDRLAQAGDLDGAEQLLRSALRQDPDNAELRARYGRICLHLAQIFAAKEKWGESTDALKRGRAMFPQDKGWRARLLLLEHLKELPKAERESWLHLLG